MSSMKRLVLYSLVTALVLINAGCLDFEKQTVVLVFPKDGKEVHALIVYEGLFVRGGKGDGQEPEKEKCEGCQATLG